MKHTPGPWRVEEDCFDQLRIVGPKGGAIAIHVGEANAALVAAAPELLKALEEARGAISDELAACGFDEIEQNPILKSHERTLKRVEAALRKARG